MQSLCRDCDHLTDGRMTLCPKCQSGRIVSHARLSELSIAHIDCDAFYAAVEKRDNPDLKDKPVIVGGGHRGVVSTCCYIARLHGIHSAMPMFKALKACPEVIVIRPRHNYYSEVSKQIREKLQALSPLVQMISIDEGYLDLSGTERVNGAVPAVSLSRIAREIEAEIGITISVGLADNKFLAKTASELDKPRGFAALSSEEAPVFLAPKPIKFLHGVGKQFAQKLARDQLHTVGDVQSRDVRSLIHKYGETGLWLHQRAHGIDNRPVHTGGERKSVSAERTFDRDISALKELEDRLWQVCEETAARAKRHEIEGSTVTLKLKTNKFRSLTRSITLATPTNLAQTLFRVARPLLQKEIMHGRAYRLIGVGISHLETARGDVRDLVDPSVEKRAKAELASDAARSKFGKSAVVTGRAVRLEQKRSQKS